MYHWLLIIVVFLGGLSVYFDNNIIQLVGFVFSIFLVLLNSKNWAVATLSILLSIIILFFDQSGMGSKSIILLYLYYESKKLNISGYFYLRIREFNKLIYIVLIAGFPLTFLQMFSGEGATGAFGLVRGAAYFWDPNYFSIFLLAITNIFNLAGWFFLAYSFVGQALTSSVAYLAYRIMPKFNFIILFGVVFLYVVFSQIDFDRLNDVPWVSERIYSFSIRVEMLQMYMSGDALDGAAPHMSFLSGFKKNPLTTLLFFIILPFFCSNTKLLAMYLVISMTYDVFFGPLCFLIPFAINSGSESRELFKNKIDKKFYLL